MGLDMYLTATKYVGRWNHSKETEKQAYDTITKAIGLEGHVCEGAPSLNVEIMLCYWRKANAIHKWFVDNVQNGEDNCGRYYVDREKLRELIDLCRKVMESRDSGELPPQAGFFFGSTAVDDWYWDDLQHTIDQLQAVLDDKKFAGLDLFYQSSW